MFTVYDHWGINWENDMAWDSTLRIIEKKSEQEIAHIVMTKWNENQRFTGEWQW